MTLFTFFSQFILILFMTCSLRHVHNLFMTCSQVAHYLFTFLHLYKFTWIILLTLLYLTYFPYPIHYFTLTLTNLLTIFALNYFTLGEASLKKNWKIWGKFPKGGGGLKKTDENSHFNLGIFKNVWIINQAQTQS